MVTTEKVIPQFTENAYILLCRRYLREITDIEDASEFYRCNRCDQKHETPIEMFERVSFGNIDYYNLMARLDFLPNSPTLFNAGIEGAGTFSACFQFVVPDSMDGIMEVARKSALVQKWGGGVGYYLGNIRPKDSPIKSTHGKSCGPVSVMKDLYQGVALMITQAGKRRGAQMGILPCDHPDLIEFIHCKDDNPQALDTFNISVSCSDRFMNHAVIENSPENEILKVMAQSAWKTGDPGCYFFDTSEKANPTPWIGELLGVNPCSEVQLLDDEPCNLGSINLVNFVLPDSAVNMTNTTSFDYKSLREAVILSIRFLDDILDHNNFPVDSISIAALRTRKLGLGVMGWADVLKMLKIPYDSDKAVELAGYLMGFIQNIAHQTSKELADEKGVCPAFSNALMPGIDDVPYRRNATLTCIAPTGTIAILAGVSSGIEPHFALENTRTTGDGIVMVEKVDTNGFVPKVADEINWKWHIDHQAAFQKHVDLGISKTVNVSFEATPEDFYNAYVYAWRMGTKGVTVYRDQCRDEQVLSKIIDIKAEEESNDWVDQYLKKVTKEANGYREVKPRPKAVNGKTDRVKTGHGNLYVTVNSNETGQPFELFGTLGKAGGCDSGQLEAISRLVSLCLRSGVDPEDVAKQLRGISCCPNWDNGILVKSVPDAIAGVLSNVMDVQHKHIEIESDLMKPTDDGYATVGRICPLCSSPAIFEGCWKCSECDWSRCE